MTLPTNFNTGRVHLRSMDTEGVPTSGSVKFVPDLDRLVDPSELLLIIPVPHVEPLDANGELTLDLPGTDDGQILPVDWTWHVTEQFPGGKDYHIPVPVGSLTELWSIVGVDAATGVANIVGPPGANGAPGPPGASSAVTEVAPYGNNSTDQTAVLQAGLNTAAAAGSIYALHGAHVVSGTLVVPAGLTIDGTCGSIRQSASLTPVFSVAGAGVRFRNVLLYGKTSDYMNSSGVYQACGVSVASTATDLRLAGCRFLGMAGAGVLVTGAASDFHFDRCKFTGPGATYITGPTFNYSGGLVIGVGGGATNWSAHKNEISGFAQGIVTSSNMANVRLTKNYVHDIPGQHGMYLEACDGMVVTGNIIRDTGLLGMKVQIAASSSIDSDAIVISGNVVIDVGDNGILLTKISGLGGPLEGRHMVVTSNIVRGTTGGSGIAVIDVFGAIVANNVLSDLASHGIYVFESGGIQVRSNQITGAVRDGVFLQDTNDWSIEDNRIDGVATGNVSGAESGIQIANATGTADGTIKNNKITDLLGNMKYGILLGSGVDQATLDIVDNQASVATDYGFRGIAAAGIRTYRGNRFVGTLGDVLNPPAVTADSIPVIGANSLASGTNAFAPGQNCVASGNYSEADGRYALARTYGQRAQASGQQVVPGDAQTSVLTLYGATTDATQTILGMAGTTTSHALLDGQTVMFVADVVARASDATSAAWRLKGAVHKEVGVNSAILGTPTLETLVNPNAWSISAVAASVAGALLIKVTGEAAKSIHWVCRLTLVEAQF